MTQTFLWASPGQSVGQTGHVCPSSEHLDGPPVPAPHGPVNLKLALAPTSQLPLSLPCSVCARACAGAGDTPTLTAILNRYKFWALQLWCHDNGFEHGIHYNVHNLFYGSKNTRWLRNIFCSNKLWYRSNPEMDQRGTQRCLLSKSAFCYEKHMTFTRISQRSKYSLQMWSYFKNSY